MKFIKKIADIITNILLVVIIVAIFFALYGFYQLKVQNKTYINYFGYTFFEVISGSMAPTIDTYDLVVIKLDEVYKKDDIITFYKDNSFITHRIIEYKDDEHILTKGDANNTTDKEISKNIIIGKVIFTFKHFGIIKRVLVDSRVLLCIFSTVILYSLAFSITGKKDDVNEE